MKKLILSALLYLSILSCKKAPTPTTLQIVVSKIDANTTYYFSMRKGNTDYLTVSNGTENKSYTVGAASGDTFTVPYDFTTKGTSVGVGVISFMYGDMNRGAVANGSGTTTVTIP